MPNRIIKESIRTSRSVNRMSDFQFRLWVYLITYADDFGRGSADPELLKGLVFPRRRGITESTIEKALADLANNGSVTLYQVGGEPYFCFPNWGDHQRIRECKPKYPAPEDADAVLQSAASCGELQQAAALIQSNPNPNPNPESESNPNDSAEHASGSAPAILLPLNDGTEHPVYQEQCHEWAGLYPAVDVIQQLREMRGWLLSNPKKRKTKRGVESFITRWLAKEQDRGARCAGVSANGRGIGPYAAPEGRADDVKRDMERMERYRGKYLEGKDDL